MIHRPLAASQIRCVADSSGYVLLGMRHCLFERIAERQPGGERSSERAAGAMRAPPCHPLIAKFEEPVPVVQEINNLGGDEMTALDDHCSRTVSSDPLCRLAAVAISSD